ncbi:MAG: (Fe-S)-binding protein [Actinomycetota bacterium]|nr:(Fe-S)-binding protein [Actinomycetota bacterium]
MSNMLIVILVSVAIALFLAILIILVSIILPKEKKKPEKVEQILQIMPKRDCGACGFIGCEDYARAVAEDPSLAQEHKCPFILRDEQKLPELEKLLGVKIDKSKKKK